MERLSEFNFLIRYTTGKSNQKADILSRREQDIAIQHRVKADSRSRLLLAPDRLDERINFEIGKSYVDITGP